MTRAPAGSGVQPLGILRMIAMLSALGDVPAEIAFCFATGNTARLRNLDCGLIEPGQCVELHDVVGAAEILGVLVVDLDVGMALRKQLAEAGDELKLHAPVGEEPRDGQHESAGRERHRALRRHRRANQLGFRKLHRHPPPAPDQAKSPRKN